LINCRNLAWKFRFRSPAQSKWKHRLSTQSIQQQRSAFFCDGNHDIKPAPVSRDGREIRRRRVIQVPDVMPDILKVPESFTRPNIERDDAVREEIVALSIHANEVGPRCTHGGTDDSPRFVQRHSAPAMSAVAGGTNPRLRAKQGSTRRSSCRSQIRPEAHASRHLARKPVRDEPVHLQVPLVAAAQLGSASAPVRSPHRPPRSPGLP
jgi:hypothetical protein